jgi:hypothetical protein
MNLMENKYFNWLTLRYPQNFIIRHPYLGTVIVSVFVFGFTVLYNPLSTHAAGSWSYALTMAVYSILSSASLIPSVWLLRSFKKFSDPASWVLYKEIVADLLLLIMIGITIYFLGFLVESSGDRWNLLTFFDSVRHGILLSIIPFAYFSAINYTYLFSPKQVFNSETAADHKPVVQIISQLKKEELRFDPSELIYAESDGNYVDFYLLGNNTVHKETIRNSINNVELQLSGIPWLFRSHRAFIVNLKKVRSKQGNSLGYLLRLDGTDVRIPVSRNNTSDFNRQLAKYSIQ